MAQQRRRASSTSAAGAWSPLAIALFSALLVAVTTLAYLPAWDGRPVWDDDAHMTRPELRSAKGLLQIWTQVGATQQYYPLVHSAFWLQHQLWGDWPRPYHLTNILLHATAALLLWRILARLAVPGAALAAAIFALHPVHVESVAWISELKNTLSAVFCLGAGLAYLRFDERRNRSAYAVALLLFVCALLSKTVVASLPAVLLVIFWWRRGSISYRRDVLPLLPFFAIGIVAGLFTVWMERTHIGAQGPDYELSIAERFLIAGRAFWFYVGKLVWPAELTFIYPRWEIDPGAPWQYLFSLSGIALLAALVLYRERWRGLLAAVLVFGGMLFPVLGFLNVYPFIYSFVADHFQYLPSAAIITAFSAGIVLLFRRLRITDRPPAFAFYACLLLTLTCLTWRQARGYADAETLYRTTLATNPAAWMAHNNLGNILVQKGDGSAAVTHYRRAIELRPNYVEALYNLGNALLQQGAVDEAITHCQAALRLDPHSVEAHNNLGNALRQANRPADAISHYRRALELRPESVFVRNNLAWTLATANAPNVRNPAQAIRLAEEADRLSRGSNPIVLHTLAAAYAAQGRAVQALETAERGLEVALAERNDALADALRRQISSLEAALSATLSGGG